MRFFLSCVSYRRGVSVFKDGVWKKVLIDVNRIKVSKKKRNETERRFYFQSQFCNANFNSINWCHVYHHII